MMLSKNYGQNLTSKTLITGNIAARIDKEKAWQSMQCGITKVG